MTYKRKKYIDKRHKRGHEGGKKKNNCIIMLTK